jgi:hypothetical protein
MFSIIVFGIYQLGFFEVSEISFRLGSYVLCWSSHLSIYDSCFFHITWLLMSTHYNYTGTLMFLHNTCKNRYRIFVFPFALKKSTNSVTCAPCWDFYIRIQKQYPNHGTRHRWTKPIISFGHRLTSATTWKQKQINAPLTHSNQFQLFHDSNKQQ